MPELSPTPIKVLILSGLPAAGKSAYAAAWVAEDPINRVEINYDDLRLQMFGSDWKFNRPDEDRMKERAEGLFLTALQEEKDVIVSNTSLSIKARERWKHLAQPFGATVEQMEINPGVAECIRRDSLRPANKRVGEALISHMALFYGFYDWRSILKGRMAVIFDVDGTLSNPSRRKHYLNKTPKDWRSFFAECHLDTPTGVVNLANDLKSLDYEIIVVSGRPIDECGLKTETWLKAVGVPYDHLFLRRSGDYRPDNVIKQEILDHLPKDSIAYVVDDRDQVVKMWRDNGLTCLQCAEGAF